MKEREGQICNVAWPCGADAVVAVKVFDTLPRFACREHETHVLERGAETRSLSETPGPFVAPAKLPDQAVTRSQPSLLRRLVKFLRTTLGFSKKERAPP